MSFTQTSKSDTKSFNFFLRRSSYVHGILVLCALLGSKVAFDLAESERAKNLELIQASVRVDMVAMPTHTIKELKNISSGMEVVKGEESKEKTPEEKVSEKEAAKETAKEEEAKEETKEDVNDQSLAFEKEAKEKLKAEQKRNDFLSKLKKISNKKVEVPSKGEANKKVENTQKGMHGANESSLKNLVMSGNKLSQGTALTGDGGSGNLTAFQAYASRLPEYVRPYWTLPSFLMDKSLQCRIRVWLNSSGQVVKASVYQSSGDREYDQRAVDAVKAASPFPELKDEFGQRAQNGDILLGFPL